MSYRGVKTPEGWWVKATSDGQPYPLNTRLVRKYEEEKVHTLYDALAYGSRTHGDQPCMLTRQLTHRERIEKNGKTLEKLTLGEYKAKTYKEVKQIVDKLSLKIRGLGIEEFDRVGVFAETREEWFISTLACLKNRVTVCTLYTTLNEIGLGHGINETEVEVVFTSSEQLQRLMPLFDKKRCPKVKRVVVMEDQLEGMGKHDFSSYNIEFIGYSDLLKDSKSSAEATTVSQARGSDIAIIMYTSGSTGTPKGVELMHSNILAAAAGYSVQMNVGVGDRYLAYLPLAHIMELATETALISLGVTIYYSSPHTLTSNSPKVKKGTVGDARLAKPTTMNAVPLVIDRIIKGVNKAVEIQGWLKSLVFNGIVRYKFWLEYIPLASTVLDYAIFNKVKEELGGELKRLIVGGAPLSPQTHNTFRAIFGCSIQVGYGSTEAASSIAGMNEDDVTTGSVGGPNIGVLLKLEDWQEGGYLTTDQPYPRGEIVVGGIVVAKGYFKNENVDGFFTEHGHNWFRTGDIGEIDSTGNLKILDRKKDLVKLKHGEYVSLGSSESILKTLPIVDNICVFADSTKEHTVAVLVPSEDRLRQIALSVTDINMNATMETICSNEKVKNEILKELQNHGRKNGLTRWEIPADLYVTTDCWTPDSGLVTAALKLKRKQLCQKYQNMIRDMYSKLD